MASRKKYDLDVVDGLPEFYDDITGEKRRMGTLPPTEESFARMARRMRSVRPVDQSLWVEFEHDPGPVAIKDQDGAGACFPAGTMIRMADGTRKPIDEVRVLDEVLTAEGNVRPVIRTMVRREADSLYRVELQGHRHLKATGEHPILTHRGYVAVVDLMRGDMVAMPRYAAEGARMIQVADYVPRRTLAIKSSRSVRGVVGRKTAVITRIALPDVIHLTTGFGRIVGMFLAEGNTDSGKVCWTFNATEEHTLAAELVGLIRDELGAEAAAKVRKTRCVVTLYGTQWAHLFEALCARYSSGKCPHPDLMAGPREFQAAMLSGWSDGDNAGHRDRGETGGVSVSRRLSGAMYDIATALGLRPAVRHYPAPRLSEGVKSRQPRWDVLWMEGERQDDYRCRQDQTHVWRRVDGVVREDFSGYVFNLEVEGDHSYVAEGIGVHNCNGHACASSAEWARLIARMTHVPFSAWFAYAIMCNGVDVGSSIDDALKLATSLGLPPESTVPYGTINPRKLSADSYAQAKKNVVEAGEMVTSFDEMMYATQRFSPGDFSIRVGGNFNNLDADGCPGYSPGMGNHAVTYGLGAKRAKSGQWAIKCQNSWGPKWGLNGYFWVTKGFVDNQRYFQAYTVYAVHDSPDDATDPKAIAARIS